MQSTYTVHQIFSPYSLQMSLLVAEKEEVIKLKDDTRQEIEQLLEQV